MKVQRTAPREQERELEREHEDVDAGCGHCVGGQ